MRSSTRIGRPAPSIGVPQVAADVGGQRLEGRDVEGVEARGGVVGQFGQGGQEPGQRLAAAGRGDEEGGGVVRARPASRADAGGGSSPWRRTSRRGGGEAWPWGEGSRDGRAGKTLGRVLPEFFEEFPVARCLLRDLLVAHEHVGPGAVDQLRGHLIGDALELADRDHLVDQEDRLVVRVVVVDASGT